MRIGRSTDMTQGTIWKQLLSFAAPMLLGLIFQQMYNTVDSIVVGNYVSSQALAAVGTTGPLINTLLGFFNGFSTGATVVIARAYGARDRKSVHDAVHTTILTTFLMAILFTGLGMYLTPYLLRMMKTPGDMMSEATTYLRIYFMGVSGLMFYNMGAGILRAVGDSRRPLYFLVFSAIVNTAGDLIFVLVFHMGVAGVAYATILAQALSAMLVLYVLAAMIRLAYFNVTEQERKQTETGTRKYYTGLPVTAAALIVPLVLLLQYLIPADLTPCYFLTIAITGAAFLMRFHIKKPGLRGVLILVGLGALEFVLILLCEVLIR